MPPRSTAINHPNQFFEEGQKLKASTNEESSYNLESNHNEESFLNDCKYFFISHDILL